MTRRKINFEAVKAYQVLWEATMKGLNQPSPRIISAEHERILKTVGEQFHMNTTDLNSDIFEVEERGAVPAGPEGSRLIADRIKSEVEEAMQQAEELGGPDLAEYADMMEQIAAEASRRAKVARSRILHELLEKAAEEIEATLDHEGVYFGPSQDLPDGQQILTQIRDYLRNN